LEGANKQRAADLLRRLQAEAQSGFADPQLPDKTILKRLEDLKACFTSQSTQDSFLQHDGDVSSSVEVPNEALEPTIVTGTESFPGNLEQALQALQLSEPPADHDAIQGLPSNFDAIPEIPITTTAGAVSVPPSFIPDAPPPPGDEDIVSTLASLYLDYRKSISALVAIATPPRHPPLPVTDPDDTRAEIVMTKAQYQLTLEEGDFWDKLLTTGGVEVGDEALDNLARTSEMMSDSFNRRTSPPTAEVYNECKEVIRAMGLPCIDSAGAFEAEALASSMVLNGLADYVASEDTVSFPLARIKRKYYNLFFLKLGRNSLWRPPYPEPYKPQFGPLHSLWC
jgi:hypothetical protein